MKKFRLLKHYNYGYVQEYEFSPSNTPLLQYHNRKNSLRKERSYRDICSVFFISRCLGMEKGEGEEKRRRRPVLELEGQALASMEDVRELSEASDFGGEEDDDNHSVDERAEKFIEKFYEEIKLQRQESLLEQFNAMALAPKVGSFEIGDSAGLCGSCDVFSSGVLGSLSMLVMGVIPISSIAS
ncbi:hypothetical protein HAX54_049842 [Datura stramonium]|uniref:Uncharacterized protein n=1 Tax=Datura stramonium TaxID=4076 RepID=A0ABS8SW19_DATST|nr:hypothetical protein [Datura stramonium]